MTMRSILKAASIAMSLAVLGGFVWLAVLLFEQWEMGH